MTTLKILGVVAVAAALIGGGAYWLRRRKQASGTPQNPQRAKPGPTPEDLARDDKPRGHILDEIPDELAQMLNEEFKDSWPPDAATIDELTSDNVVVFAVESEVVGNYDQIRRELISAKVLSVEKTVVRGRIIGPVAHAEHHGSHAGHAFRVGDQIDIPRSKILVAAYHREPDRTGYDSHGRAERTFKPSNHTKETYKVKPGTPYDLVMPYRTENLQWSIDHEHVTLDHVGDKGLLEQVMFTEDSMRGEHTARVLDNDPEVGLVFVARWDFVLEA